jgi:hypothetical protein
VQTYLIEQIQEERLLSPQEAQKPQRFEINPPASLRGGEEWERGEGRSAWRRQPKLEGLASSLDNGERECGFTARGGKKMSSPRGGTNRKAQVREDYPTFPTNEGDATVRELGHVGPRTRMLGLLHIGNLSGPVVYVGPTILLSIMDG